MILGEGEALSLESRRTSDYLTKELELAAMGGTIMAEDKRIVARVNFPKTHH